MKDTKKITIILIRLQAVSFVLLSIIQWGIIAVFIVMESLRETPNAAASYEYLLISSALYLIMGLILYARSKSLANYFISGVQGDE